MTLLLDVFLLIFWGKSAVEKLDIFLGVVKFSIIFSPQSSSFLFQNFYSIPCQRLQDSVTSFSFIGRFLFLFLKYFLFFFLYIKDQTINICRCAEGASFFQLKSVLNEEYQLKSQIPGRKSGQTWKYQRE